MKKTSLLHTLLLVSSLFLCYSCSDDDNYADPEGTITLNMLNADNGKTLLGNSDVYMDQANNFNTVRCMISSLGKRSGLGNFPAPLFNKASDKIAVEAGVGYQIFNNNAIREFPSGKLALHIDGDYYNVYVTSLNKKEDEVIGATVKFALIDVPKNDLPDYNSNIGSIDGSNYELIIELPTSDFEYEPSNSYNQIEYEKDGNKLIMRLKDYVEDDYFGAYIRIKESYTYVYGTINF